MRNAQIQYLTASELAREAGVPAVKISRLVRAGKLKPAISKPGVCQLFKPGAVALVMQIELSKIK